MKITKEKDGYGIPRWTGTDSCGRRRYSYDAGLSWRGTAKKARSAATRERDDAKARAVLECRMVAGT